MAKDIERMSVLFSRDDMARIKEKAESISVDLHGLDCKRAIRLLNNIVNLTDHAGRIEAIHGYNHGTAILEAIRTSYSNRKVRSIRGCRNNPGITYLEVA